MEAKIETKRFTQGEEIANAVSHGLGAAFSIVALVLLIVFATKLGNTTTVVSVIIFGASMLTLYLSSAFNHSLKRGSAKDFFHNFDQIAIFLLIAGTYTPLALVTLKGDWGWTMFGLQWGLAAAGITAKLFMPNRFEKGVNIFFVLSYVLMGWMLLFFLFPIFRNLPPMGIGFIFIGGGCYTLGTFFFKWEKLPYSHLIWHLFVLAGSTCHWLAIFLFVVPARI